MEEEDEEDEDLEYSRQNDDQDESNEVNVEYDDEEEDEDEDGGQNGYNHVSEDEEDEDEDDSERHRKKRKLKSLVSDYEFAPRVSSKPSFGKNSPAEWTEKSTLVLLDTWGDKFLDFGRKSLRSEDWHDVAEKVSEVTNTQKTESQCRNRLDRLKKKYKKEKAKLEENGGGKSKWVYFMKMDILMNAPQRQQQGLACGVDSGEFVFTNTAVYLNRSNGFDEMRDSPGESESSDNEEGDDDSDGLPPKRNSYGRDDDGGASFGLLADSIQKFGEIYEKIENSKRQQMIELEKMRMESHKELELQKKQILEKAQIEIAKMQQEDDEDTDPSAENLSG